MKLKAEVPDGGSRDTWVSLEMKKSVHVHGWFWKKLMH
jgi:hypothetical protein